METLKDEKQSKEEEEFNAFKNIQWRFVDSNITRTPSRRDLLQYPSEVLTDPRFQDENTQNFRTWKQNYFESMDVTNFMYNELNDDSPQFTENQTNETYENSTNQILFINADDDDYEHAHYPLQPPSFAPDSARTKRIPQTEEEILRETEEYLISLNRISKYAENIQSNQTKYVQQPQNAENEYMQKRKVFSTIPSTEQLLQNVTDFEQQCKNEKLYSSRSRASICNTSRSVLSDDEWNNSRSPSPVIIWRPSSRITIARDLPSNLKSVFSPDIEQNHHAESTENNLSCLEQDDNDNDINNDVLKKEEKKKQKKERWNSNKRNLSPKIVYGAWYIHPKKWVVKRKGKVTEYNNDNAKNPVLEKKASDLAKTIPELFISKKYKEYILNQKNPNKRNLPDYLQNVECT